MAEDFDTFLVEDHANKYLSCSLCYQVVCFRLKLKYWFLFMFFQIVPGFSQFCCSVTILLLKTSTMKISVAIFAGILVVAASSPIEKGIAENRQTNNVNDFCVTRECIETSHRFFKSMNQSADPCDDFYEVLIVGILGYFPI